MELSGRAMVALLVILGLHSATATQYTVGNSGGWTYQTGSNSVYTSQFQSINLVVGDTLLFPYSSGVHNVYEIPPAQLSSCNFANPIATYTAGNSVVTLKTAGTHAFACQIPTHCSASGMQLSVTVAAAAPTTAPVTAPAPAKPAPAPAPTTKAPAPSPKAPSPTPKTSPTAAPTPGTAAPTVPVIVPEAPAPSPASPGNSGSSIISSGSAMFAAVVVAGLAFLLV